MKTLKPVYLRGEVVRAEMTFTDPLAASGAVDYLVDPDVVQAFVRDTEQNETSFLYGATPDIERVEQGVYVLLVSTAAMVSGDGAVRFESHGAGETSAEMEFSVRAGSFTP